MCCTSIIFASLFAMMSTSVESEPGRSGSRTNTVSRRPSLVSFRRTRFGMRPMSMFPPERMMHVDPEVAGATLFDGFCGEFERLCIVELTDI